MKSYIIVRISTLTIPNTFQAICSKSYGRVTLRYKVYIK